jgi:hypothetical protein
MSLCRISERGPTFSEGNSTLWPDETVSSFNLAFIKYRDGEVSACISNPNGLFSNKSKIWRLFSE